MKRTPPWVECAEDPADVNWTKKKYEQHFGSLGPLSLLTTHFGSYICSRGLKKEYDR